MPRLVAAAYALLLFPSLAAAQEIAPGNWGKKADMLEANSEFTLTALNGKLYVLGGYPSTRISVKTVQIYDVASNTWKLGPPLPVGLNHGMAATVGNVIYLIGGQTDPNVGYVDTVYALDPSKGAWTARNPMLLPRSAGVAVALDGKIYVAGGRPPHGNEFAVYDPATDIWETLPDMPTPRNHVAGTAINGKIYVAGGRFGGGFQSNQTAPFEAYNPKTRTWSSAAPMLRPRSGHNGVMAYGCFHEWGGEYKDGVYPDHDVYDPRDDKWAHSPDMPIPVHGVTGAAFIDGLIRVVGGGTHNGGSSGTRLNQVYRPDMRCDGDRRVSAPSSRAATARSPERRPGSR